MFKMSKKRKHLHILDGMSLYTRDRSPFYWGYLNIEGKIYKKSLKTTDRKEAERLLFAWKNEIFSDSLNLIDGNDEEDHHHDKQKPIVDEMNVFEDKFKTSLKTRVPLLDKIMHYIIKRKGKQMRPMFVFLTAKLFGSTKESAYTAASLIELLHTATLVHDDVIDEANFRRGVFSINALWKNKISVPRIFFSCFNKHMRTIFR